MEIRAVFDDVDRAEWALVRLREHGLHPRSSHVSPLHRGYTGGGLTNSGMLVPGMAASNSLNGAGGQPWMTMEGNALPFAAMSAVPQGTEGVSREARLILHCRPEQAERIQSVLVSNGGHRISLV